MVRVGGSDPKPALLADADVVIDYQHSDLAVLALVTAHVGPLAVLTSVIEQVDGLTPKDCADLGLEVITPTVAQRRRAGEIDSAAHFTDRLCLVVARDEGRVCVTNDRTLRNLCDRLGVPTRFGLRLLVDLVAAGVLPRRRAEGIAGMIRETNSYLTERVLRRFHAALDDLPAPEPPADQA